MTGFAWLLISIHSSSSLASVRVRLRRANAKARTMSSTSSSPSGYKLSALLRNQQRAFLYKYLPIVAIPTTGSTCLCPPGTILVLGLCKLMPRGSLGLRRRRHTTTMPATSCSTWPGCTSTLYQSRTSSRPHRLGRRLQEHNALTPRAPCTSCTARDRDCTGLTRTTNCCSTQLLPYPTFVSYLVHWRALWHCNRLPLTLD